MYLDLWAERILALLLLDLPVMESFLEFELLIYKLVFWILYPLLVQPKNLHHRYVLKVEFDYVILGLFQV